MTRINPDDPKWTAYVFGELNESERAAVELELEVSEEARILVEELRFSAELTKTELREAVPVVPLTAEQRQKIRSSATAHRPRRWLGVRSPIWVAGLSVAAAAVIVLAVLIAPGPRVSQLNEPPAPPIANAEAPKSEYQAAPTATVSPKPAKDFKRRDEQPALSAVTTPAREEQIAQIAEPKAVESLKVEPAPVPSIVPTPQKLMVDPTAMPVPAMPVPPIAALSGKVQDATAAVIPGVDVTATNVETGAVAATVTNQSGAYSFEGLSPGNYRLTGSLPGFQTGVYNGIRLGATGETKQDITLQVGAVSASVEVSVADVRRQGTRQALAAASPPPSPPPPPPPSASIRSPRAPGVPPEYDRVRRRVNDGREAYDTINDNPFLPAAQNQLSTFAIDVDTASYSNVRRYLNQNQLPPRDAVRIEEMINYFAYDYLQPEGNHPIGASIEAAAAPWNPQHRLVRVAIKARDVEARRRPPSNLVFLLDVSGSMQPAERLPLLKDAIRMLVEQLTANDKVTVVTYAGTTGVALRPTRGDQKDTILRLIDSLQAGGSTNGGSGIQLAYEQATANFIPGGVNRVILATDGDFNVGITNRNALLRLIEDKSKSGVFLSVLGVGMGNYKDATLETLADKGHGNYAYLDTLNEARKVLVDQMSSTLVTVAKDVKVQVEFNPAVVDSYRLIGYENRALRNEDFNNDQKDGGDMGAGHTVTMLYEVVPRGAAINAPGIDPLKYQQPAQLPSRNVSTETLTVKVRYKEPTGRDSKLLSFLLVDREQTFSQASLDFRFAAAVASFGMILRDSPYKGTATIDSVLSIAEDSLGSDRNGYRREFLQLVQRARRISTR